MATEIAEGVPEECEICGSKEGLKCIPIMTGDRFGQPCEHPICGICVEIWHDLGETDPEKIKILSQAKKTIGGETMSCHNDDILEKIRQENTAWIREKEVKEKKEAVHSGDYLDAPWFSCPRCPWCGRKVVDWWDGLGFRNDGDEVEIECECGEKFIATISVETSFRSIRTKTP